MAINTVTLCNDLASEYLANQTLLAGLGESYSLDGQSVSKSADRDSLTKRNAEIAKIMAGLGCAIGGVNGLAMPFRVGSTWRA